ncbi:hypothetical protein [Acinetobacter baumannii]|nr:hypothetical protein [Acinetobacter baumannii]CQR90186.1 hypothetical protein [Acinetobacter baumannii]CRF36230.1 hypothetical protein [Acinetobacter baumannii]
MESIFFSNLNPYDSFSVMPSPFRLGNKKAPELGAQSYFKV